MQLRDFNHDKFCFLNIEYTLSPATYCIHLYKAYIKNLILITSFNKILKQTGLLRCLFLKLNKHSFTILVYSKLAIIMAKD